MTERSDATPNEPQKPKPEGLTGKEVWDSLLRLQQEGAQLTPSQQRALELRNISIGCLNALDELVRNASAQTDPLLKTEATANYWESIFKLTDMGIEPGMKTGQPIEFYRDPLNAAEYIAGQLLKTQEHSLPDLKHLIREAQEHSEGNESTEKTQFQYKIPTEMLSRKAIDAVVFITETNILRFYLAAEEQAEH